MTENNLKQAMVPENCTVLYNDNGTAPGMVIHASDGKKVILLPGPPSELLPMFHRQVEPVLQEMQPGILYSKVIKIDCMGESAVETEILDLIEQQSNPTVAPYAKLGEVHLRVTAKADTMEEGKELVKPMVAELRNRFGNKIYTIEGDRTLEERIYHFGSRILYSGYVYVTFGQCSWCF